MEEKSQARKAAKLKPCPFCGNESGEVNFAYSERLKFRFHRIRCSQCHAESGMSNALAGAVKKWNTRKRAVRNDGAITGVS